MEDGEIIEEAEMVDEATAREEHADIEALKRGDNIMRMELMLLRREKELWERERQLLGRELEMLRSSPMMAQRRMAVLFRHLVTLEASTTYCLSLTKRITLFGGRNSNCSY